MLSPHEPDHFMLVIALHKHIHNLFGHSFPKHNQEIPLWSVADICFEHFHDACCIAMQWHDPVLRSDLNVGFAAHHKSYFTLTLLCNSNVSTWKPGASIAAGWWKFTISQSRNCMHLFLTWAHCLRAAARFFFIFYYYSVRLATWPHRRNWQGRELSLNINRMSQGLSVRTVMAISCFAFPNTLCVGNQSGVIPDLSQQLRRGEPDGWTSIIRAVCYS